MPPDWWSIPTEFLDIRTKEASAQFERVMCQVWHFELVTLLHIPFMLHAARDRRYEYSHISCLDASRNLIKRWIAIRGSRTSLLFSELLDFQAFTAATTLLLGLLGASTSRDDLLRERHADSELIEMVIQNFERSAHNGSGKSVSAQSISVIRLLQRVLHKEEPHGSLYIEIPFFGVIQASHGGAVQPVEGERLLGANSSSTSRVDSIAAPSAIENSLGCELEDRCNDGDARENDTVLNFLDEHFQFPQRMSIQDGSNVEWPLGDSDMVFFDSLVDTDLLGSWTV